VLGVAPRTALGPAELAGLAARGMSRLAEALAAAGRVHAQVPPRGPGHELLPRLRPPNWTRAR
jgi:hypothetical protein